MKRGVGCADEREKIDFGVAECAENATLYCVSVTQCYGWRRGAGACPGRWAGFRNGAGPVSRGCRAGAAQVGGRQFSELWVAPFAAAQRRSASRLISALAAGAPCRFRSVRAAWTMSS